MKRLPLFLCVLAFAWTSYANPGPLCPTGLMTDLVEHTETVWSCGYVTDLALKDVSGAKGDFQTVEIRSSRPYLSWIVPGACGTRQNARQVIMSSSLEKALALEGDSWDSGWVSDNRSTEVESGGAPLEPSKVYYWRVRVSTDSSGESGWSDVKAFRTASELEDYATPSYPLVKESQRPSSLTNSGDVWMADFGKDAFSQLKVTLYSETGKDTVRIHLGERLEGGRVLRNPTTSARYQMHSLALRKGKNTYRIVIPPDKRNTGSAAVKMPAYIGEVLPFRYCEVEGYKFPLEADDLERETVSYPFDMDAASFSSDNEILNQVWDICRYSVKATSFTGLFVDGDRERIPYEADALISQLCHYASDREYTLSRRTLEYLLDYPTWPTEWILQSVLIAWNDYLFTGDARLLESRYDILRAHCMESLIQPNGLMSTTLDSQEETFLKSIRRKEKIRDIVDWPHSGSLGLAPGYGGEDDGFVYSDYNAVVNAYAYRTLSLMGEIASVLGKEEDAGELFKEAEVLKKAFNKFFDKKRKVFCDGITVPVPAEGPGHASLHSNMFALLFGLAPEKYSKKVADFMVSRGMACSVYGSQFLLEALYEAGRSEDALRLMTDTSLRGWYNMIRCGSTITLEAWDDSFKPNQDWNHLWGAAPGNIIPFRLMGVMPLEPGFAKVRIQPQPGSLEYAEMTLPTIRGTIRMVINNTPTNRTVTLSLPANMEFEVDLPEGFSMIIREL